jgi:DNA polymerase-3 subunit epsilon
VAIDFETATRFRNSACALGAARIVDGEVAEIRRWLIRPPRNEYEGINISIHGIRPEQTASAPPFGHVWQEAAAFIASAPVVAHNASFDLSVLRASLELNQAPWPTLDACCTLVLSRVCWPELPAFRLDVVAAECGIEFDHHEPGSDAMAAGLLAVAVCGAANTPHLVDACHHFGVAPGRLDATGWNPCGARRQGSQASRPGAAARSKRVHDLHPTVNNVPIDGPFVGKRVVFTGGLQLMTRHEAAQAVVNHGGEVADSMSMKVAFLVCGVPDPVLVVDGMHSTKELKAAELNAAGAHIEVLTEVEFFRMLAD